MMQDQIASKLTKPTLETDVAVIGSGIGGLSCAALLARYGLSAIVCESHTIPGGAAHAFERGGFHFDSGPSLYSGLSYRPSSNPLRQVLDAIGEDLPWVTYQSWGCYLPEGYFDHAVGTDQFSKVLARLRGEKAVAQWQELLKIMAPLQRAAIALPPLALRSDWGAILTCGPFAPALLPYAAQMGQLTQPFSRLLDRTITDPFLRRWLDLLCFLLSGLPASGTIAAEMAFMFAEWFRPGVVLDYPVGGSGALVGALVRGLEKYGGKLLLGAHAEQILVAGGRAVGLQLRGGEEIRAKRAVVSNASVWNTLQLLPGGVLPPSFRARQQATPECDSFLHLHLGIEASNLPSDLGCHYLVVNDWEKGITAPQNVVLVSIPSVLDPSLAPPGKHAIHAYTPGNEPYALWQGMSRPSEDYARQKQERSSVLWQALERIIPDIRSRCEVTLVGTPLTHERFLRRYRGSYGPAIRAGESKFPGPKTPLPGLLCCGDSTFPGIGLPAVAASGAIAANTLAPVAEHFKLLADVGCFG